MKTLAAFCLLLALTACNRHMRVEDPVIPISYDAVELRSKASVGRLRRLLLLPIRIDPGVADTATIDQVTALAPAFAAACQQFLTAHKGYEVITIEAREGLTISDPGGESHNAADLEVLLARWPAESPDALPGELVQQLGRAVFADGVVAIRIMPRPPWDTADALLNVPLFRRLAIPDLGAWIYQTSNGRLVYGEEGVASGGPEQPSVAAEDLVGLFRDLDNAVPRQLLR